MNEVKIHVRWIFSGNQLHWVLHRIMTKTSRNFYSKGDSNVKSRFRYWILKSKRRGRGLVGVTTRVSPLGTRVGTNESQL